MKVRFTTLDIAAALREIRDTTLGMRVVNIYDVDHKTYLIKLARSEEKAFIMFESGTRIHLTEFEWPKNMMPSSFSMKCRKHLKSRRVVMVTQLGVDRIVDLQFGSGEAAYHLILELYDKGNVLLTDYQYNIMNLLRYRTDQEAEVTFAVREVYPIATARQWEPLPSLQRLKELLQSHDTQDGSHDAQKGSHDAQKGSRDAQKGSHDIQLKKMLVPQFVYGPALLTHALVGVGFEEGALIGNLNLDDALPRIHEALQEAERVFQQVSTASLDHVSQQVSTASLDHVSQQVSTASLDHVSQQISTASLDHSCIIQKRQRHDNPIAGEAPDLIVNVEFHPMVFRQHDHMTRETFPSFNKAVDRFFSQLGAQKIDVHTHNKERAGLKKLENVRSDHLRRISELQSAQEEDCLKAELIEMNIDLVGKACDVINGAVASAMDWGDIVAMVKEARIHGDPVATAIHQLHLERNHMILLLCNPYDEKEVMDKRRHGNKIEIDLDLTAYANARRYYDHKRFAVTKQQKTIDASSKAMKSAERKTKQALKEVAKVATIRKARKTYWFEKFYWFISSENYLVVGGRDQQQNELIVKRYLTQGDLYVHADLHGATSCVVKNPTRSVVPRRTLQEAGTMATCYSNGWEGKTTSGAWWVWSHQVSKTAPSGEYLTTGSFMIRGKKNFLAATQLVLGFGFLFKLDEGSVANHHGDRKVKEEEDDLVSMASNDVTVAMESVAMELENSSESSSHSDDEQDAFPDTVIGLGGNHGYSSSFTGNVQQLKQKKLHSSHENEVSAMQKTVTETTSRPKRGQKFKQKRIQERYGNQDDEDRELHMNLLASAGTSKKKSCEPNKKNKKDKKNSKHKYHNHGNSEPLVQVTSKQQDPVIESHNQDHVIPPDQDHVIPPDQDHVTLPDQDHVTPPDQDHVTSPDPDIVISHNLNNSAEEESDHESDDKGSGVTQLLDSLTGCPSCDDVILFAVPVCAPYSAVMSYKYKVKFIPGMQRRGKAARMALHGFLQYKEGSQIERDLLKSVKDNDLSRYFPGKVKLLVAANQKVKHK